RWKISEMSSLRKLKSRKNGSGSRWKSRRRHKNCLFRCRFRRPLIDVSIEREFAAARAPESTRKPNSVNSRRTHMRFLSIYKHEERTTPPTAAEMETMGKLVEEGM